MQLTGQSFRAVAIDLVPVARSVAGDQLRKFGVSNSNKESLYHRRPYDYRTRRTAFPTSSAIAQKMLWKDFDC